MLGFLPSSGFQRYPLNSRVSVAPAGFGQALPPVIFEFFGSANSTIPLTFRHSGAMRSIEPGISRFRVWSFGPSRNDDGENNVANKTKLGRRDTMRKLIFAAIATLALTAQASAADKVVLMLNWYVYGEHAPFYYGKAKGIYAAEGIDLEIQEGRGSAATTQAVAAKTANFGYVDVPTMMRAAVKGAPITATGVLLQTSPMSAMGFVEKNIKKPEDIKGKTVAITPADSMTQIWPLFLKKTGLKESDFQTVAGDGQTKLNAVINGQADLLLGYVMDQSMKIKDATGKDVNAIKFADYGINMVCSGIVANTDFVKANADLVKRFMSATTKAVE